MRDLFQEAQTDREELQHSIMQEIYREMSRQDVLWGPQKHPDGTSVYNEELADQQKRANDSVVAATPHLLAWVDILSEEVLEAYAETNPIRLREELVQVAAVAGNWIADIDNRVGQHE